MTQTPTTINSSPAIRADDNPYLNRILRIVIPVISIAISIFALLGIRGVAAAANSDLQNDHAQGLARVSNIVSNQMETIALQLESLQSDLELQAYLRGEADADRASRRGAELIELNPNLYQHISYIRLSLPGETEPVVVFERLNLENRFSAVQTATRPFEFARSSVFQTASNSPDARLFVDDFRLNESDTADLTTTVLLDLYYPIYNQFSSTPVMVIHAVIDAQPIRSLVNLSIGDLVNEEAGRHMLLVDGENRVVADSGAVGDSYIRELDAIGGNSITTNLYEEILNDPDLVPDSEPDFNPASQNIISLTVPDFEPLARAGWRIYMVDNGLAYFSTPIIINVLIGLLSLLTGIGSVWFLRRTLKPILQPVYEAEEIAQQAVAGVPVTSIHTESPDSELVSSVRYITSRIDRLSTQMETQTKRRSRDMQIAGRIGREAAAQSDLDALVKRSINLICNELGFYHAQVFLLDDSRTVAVLRYSRGEAGEQLIAQGHQLAVGSDTIIGTVTAEARPVIVNDTLAGGEDPHAFNPILPDTRAEMGLPLVIGNQVIGALDVQSLEPDVFLDDDLPTYQLVADQLAIAIYNAELRETSQRRIEQIDRLNRQLTRDAWQEMERRLSLSDHYGSQSVRGNLTAPITIRGQEVGRIEADLPDQNFSDNDRQILESVAQRVALAIENARLFQETQVSLSETSTLYQLSRQLNEANTLEDVLEAIIVTVATNASGGQVWLFDESIPRDQPRQIIASVDLPVMLRPDNLNLEGLTLVFDDYPLFDRLSATEAYFLTDIDREADIRDDLRDLMTAANAYAVVFIPLNMRGVWKGFISITFEQAQSFEESTRRIYNALIGQAGVAIDNRLLLQQTEDALARQEKLYAASRIINTSQNLADLVYAAVATASDPRLDFWLALLEGERDADGWPQQAHIVAHSEGGIVAEDNTIFALAIAPDSPMRNREPEILTDLENSAHVAYMLDPTYKFAAIFPLFSENLPTALFYIVSRTPYELSQDDYEVYRALTGQMSTQIQNRQLLEQTENTLTEIRRLYVASRAISSADDDTAIYEAVAGHLAMPFIQLSTRSDQEINISLTVLLARPEPSIDAPELHYVYQWISDPTRPEEHPVGTVLSQIEAPIGSIIAENDDSLVLYRDLDNVPEAYPRLRVLLSENRSTAAAIAPLWSRQRWFGALIVRTDRADLMDESYARFMQAVADQVAIAVENQTLLNESLTQRQRLSEILAALPTGVLVLNPQTMTPIQHNQQLEQLLGREIDPDLPFTAENYGFYRSGTNMAYPDQELPFFAALHSDQQTIPVDDVVIFDPVGMRTDLLVSAVSVFEGDSQQNAIVAVFQDVTTLRSMENTMQENLRETVMLYETQRALNEAEGQEELLNAIVSQLAMQQPSDAFLILTTGDDEIELARSLMNPVEDVYAFWPLLKTDTVIIDDITRLPDVQPDTRQLFETLDARSAMVLPLRVRTRKRPIGWIALFGYEPETFTFDQERTLTSVADMASQALDNAYLVQSTQEALLETATLYRANTAISRARDKAELYEAIEGLMFTLRPDVYLGYLTVDDTYEEMFKHGFDEYEAQGFDIQELRRQPIGREEGIYVNDLRRTTLGDLESFIASQTDMLAFAAINLRVKDMPGGRIFLGYKQPRSFGDGDVRFLNTIADSASVVIDNQSQREQIQNTLQETSVLYQASKALIDTSEPDEIVDVIVNYLIEPHINQVFVALLNGDSWERQSALANVVSGWHMGTGVDLVGFTLSPESFSAWNMLNAPTVLTIDDVEDADNGLTDLERESLRSLEARSVAVIPLRVPGRDIGAIWLSSSEPYEYEDRDQRIFQAFGEQTSLTLEAKRLVDQTERRARQLQTSAIISQNVGQILDLDVLLPQVVDLIREQFRYDHVQVFLMDDENDWALLRASTGEAGQQLLNVGHRLQRGSDSVIGQVTATGHPAIALDTADADVVHKPNPFLPMTRSEMALPMIVKGEIVGALDVQSNQPNAFNEEDVQVLTLLASQIAVAIDNARLYEGTQQSARDMAFLFELTTDAAAAESLAETLDLITFRVRDNLRADVAAIYLPQEYEDFNDNRKTLMELEALARADTVEYVETPSIEVGDPEHLIGIATSGLQPQLITNVEREIRYNPLDSAAKSAVLVPIVSGLQLVGLVVLESRRVGAYSSEALTLLQALAGSLSAIVQNTLLVEQLRETNDQLREIDKLKSQFLANMSHELRTPLNSIIGFSRVMLKGIDGPLTDMQEQDLTTIYNSGNHLLSLINDILDQAKIEANELNLKFGYFDVKPMVESVKSIAIGYMKDKPDLQLEVEVAPNLPQAYGDEFRSRQILLNLVSNAIKFTKEGGVTIRVYAIPGDTGPLVRLDVTDTGIGIEAKDLPTVFEQFRQVDSSLTRTVGGTGLGLPISKSLAELQGGDLVVESEVGAGSTFSVLIPTYEGAEETLEQLREVSRNRKAVADVEKDVTSSGLIKREDVQKAKAQAESAVTQPSKDDTQEFQVNKPQPSRIDSNVTQAIPAMMNQKRDVILVEDNKDMVDQFRRVLQREGFEVTTAEHPSYAEAMVGQIRPSLVLLDVNFADGQGWQVLEQLKERDDTFDIPIVVTTMSDESERAYRLGAHTFLQRPFLPDDLVEAVLAAERESQRERILIIDDQPDTIRLLTQLLNEQGDFKVFSAQSGDEGISLVARRRPDLIILDLRMPDKDGFAVLDELRGNPETAKIPVMIVTGDVDFNSSEQEALANLRVVPKTDISQEEYEQFIDNVRSYLKQNNGSHG